VRAAVAEAVTERLGGVLDEVRQAVRKECDAILASLPAELVRVVGARAPWSWRSNATPRRKKLPANRHGERDPHHGRGRRPR
jgi:hypothetical protein